MFQEKLIDLCKTTTKFNNIREQEEFDGKTSDGSSAERSDDISYTLPMKVALGQEVKLTTVVVHIDVTGLAICDPTAVSSDADSQDLKVLEHYPFTNLASWTDEGRYVVLEVITAQGEGKRYNFKAANKKDSAAFVEAIQVCLATAMKHMEAKKAARLAAKEEKAAATVEGTEPVATGPKKPTKADRMRRASLVVEMASLAGGIGGDNAPDAGAIDDIMNQNQEALMAAACRAIDHDGGFVVDDDDDLSMTNDIIDVITDEMSAPLTGRRMSLVETRRQSVMADMSGQGGEMDAERAKRSGLLKDLASFVEDSSKPETIAEGYEDEDF